MTTGSHRAADWSLRVDRDALLLWLITISQPLLILAFQVSGVFRFTAAGYANRLWAALVLLILAPAAIRTVGRPGVYLGVIMLAGLWGVAMGNQAPDILADVVLLGLGAVFLTYGRRIARKGPAALRRFLREYFFLNLGSLVVLTMPVFLLGYRVSPDVVFLAAVLVVGLFRGKAAFRPIMLVGQAILALFVGSKTFLIQLALAMVAMAFRYRVTAFVVALAIALPITLLVQEGSFLRTSMTTGRTEIFVRSVQSTISEGASFTDVLADPFAFVDASTAERVYELVQAVGVVAPSPATWALGTGLGGAFDISGTGDDSVVRSHGDARALESVRVVHLGVAFALLKGGAAGLLAYLTFIGMACVRGVRAVRGAGSSWEAVVGLTLLMYAIGSLFTFSIYFKLPGLWITWVLAGVLVRERQSRLRGIYGLPAAHPQRA